MRKSIQESTDQHPFIIIDPQEQAACQYLHERPDGDDRLPSISIRQISTYYWSHEDSDEKYWGQSGNLTFLKLPLLFYDWVQERTYD